MRKNLIKIPSEYSQLYYKHMKVIVLISENNYDFSDIAGKLEWQGDAIQDQRTIRYEW